jgi:gamma-glutamylcyclotransferase
MIEQDDLGGTIRDPRNGVDVFYFAYDANIDPDRIVGLAPGATFEFIAHLPEWKMEFSILNGAGGLPSVRPLPGNTVWGAIFSIPEKELSAIDAQEADEGRVRTTTQAMDREGRRHDVVTHVAATADGDGFEPEQGYLALMVRGGRHWKLPTGWVASLEEHLDSF